MTENRHYKKYEFCKAEGCNFLRRSNIDGQLYCRAGLQTNPYEPYINCPFSAKKFHEWLQENNFKIVKEEIQKDFSSFKQKQYDNKDEMRSKIETYRKKNNCNTGFVVLTPPARIHGWVQTLEFIEVPARSTAQDDDGSLWECIEKEKGKKEWIKQH